MLRRALNLLIILLMAFTGSVPAHAQTEENRAGDVVPSDSLRKQVERGRTLLGDGQAAEAVSVLRSVVETAPQAPAANPGAAAYWLGRAEAAAGDSASAHAAWRAGVNALTTASSVHPRLSDAYVESVFAHRRTPEYRHASRVYVNLLRAGKGTRSGAERVLRHHVAQALDLVPETLREEIVADGEVCRGQAQRSGAGCVRPGGGEQLAAWWQQQDPRPATSRNERLIEHLRRVETAERRYPDDDRPAAYDDRGRIFVRLGAPSEVLDLDSKSLRRDGLCSLCETILSGSHAVPTNEYWVYGDLGPYAQYLFVRKGGRFVVGSIRDLIPPQIRGPSYTSGQPTASIRAGGVSGGQPASRKAGLALKILQDYYESIVRHQPEYTALLSQIDQSLLRNASGDELLGEGRSPAIPVVEASLKMREMRRLDGTVRRKREDTVPNQHTNTVDQDQPLPVAARTARFLTEHGETRTEIYWGIQPSDLSVPPGDRFRLLREHASEPDRQILRTTTVRYSADYSSREEVQNRQILSYSPEQPATYSVSLPATTTLHHLALQWDQFAVVGADSAAHVRTGMHRVDSLRALPESEERLVLSDLVPLRADSLASVPQVRGEKTFRVTPYPFDAISGETELAFYVEAYHLTPGADDRTRYTVEYRTEYRLERDGIRGWFVGDTDQVTTQSTTYESASQRVREVAALNLDVPSNASQVRVTVRVTDEVSGVVEKKSVTFAVRNTDEEE
jgi:GWxTD domain-containing protein